jgi:hypothetical protein
MERIQVDLSRRNGIKTVVVNGVTLTGHSHIHENDRDTFLMEFTNNTRLHIDFRTQALRVIQTTTDMVLFERRTNDAFLRQVATSIARPVPEQYPPLERRRMRNLGVLMFPTQASLVDVEGNNAATILGDSDYGYGSNMNSNAFSVGRGGSRRRHRRTRKRQTRSFRCIRKTRH